MQSKVTLRALEPSDAGLLYIWENDPLMWRVSWQCEPMSLLRIKEYISNASGDVFTRGDIRLMICVEGAGTPVGTVDLTDISWRHRRAEVGIFVAPEFRGKAIAAAALKEIEIYGQSFLGLTQLWSIVEQENFPACTLFEKAGYEHVGTLRRWIYYDKRYHNVKMYQLCFSF